MNVYRIVIGDDDKEFLRAAEAVADKCMTEEGLVREEDFTVQCFAEAGPLMDALAEEEDSCRLLLLDVEFGPDNGLAVASALREKGLPFSLIYITSHRDFVFDSFDTHPLHYLLKPLDEEKLRQLIREDHRRCCQDARLYLKQGGKHLSVAYQDIYAVEAAQHRTLIHLQNSAEEWAGTLTALSSKLPGWCFCQCHKSYYVNLTHVTELVRYEARLSNGQVIPISKRFYKSAIERYIAFLKN